VKAIEKVSKGPNDKPKEDVVIVNCGELPIDTEKDEHGNEEVSTTTVASTADSQSNTAIAHQLPGNSGVDEHIVDAVSLTVPVLYGGIFLVVLLALFAWVGGIRCVKRMLPAGWFHGGPRYSKVVEDRDLEK